MQTRHRIPTIFSIYMVDVLCCALGCVILLWQLYHHESEEQTAAAQQALKKLETAHLSINALTSDVDALKISLDAAKKKQIQVTLELDDTRQERDKALQLALVRKQEYDEMKKTLAAAEAMMALLRLDLKNLEKKSTLTAAELAEKIRAHADLFDKLAVAEKKLRALTKDLALKEADNKLAVKRVEEKSNLLKLLEEQLNLVRSESKDTMAKLSTADIRARLLEGDLERSKKELIDVNRRLQDLVLSQDTLSKRITVSVKDLERAKQLIAALESDKISLLKKATAAENRFAGIQLTGRRVVFLIDISGSMEMVDENVLDPDKWPLVCEAIGRVMRSLPDLRDYQVIVFSDRVSYPFGNDRRWLEFDGEATPKKVTDGLKALKPKGGTDMHAAFQESFRFRESGLDTIYVFSDGLPNIGEGMPANFPGLSETQRTDILSKYVRTKLKNTWNRPVPGQARVRINTIGFFFESPDLGAFLWALAREHDGSFVGMSRP